MMTDGERDIGEIRGAGDAGDRMDTMALLLWMKDHGSSVSLNWGEDDNLWECSWITVGERHTGVAETIDRAIHEALANARKRARGPWEPPLR